MHYLSHSSRLPLYDHLQDRRKVYCTQRICYYHYVKTHVPDTHIMLMQHIHIAQYSLMTLGWTERKKKCSSNKIREAEEILVKIIVLLFYIS